ncbi:DNA-binding protein [Chromobacterium sp. IIBBL 290-4]|uniref:DNA-binding protein n=1 Tax=Chromobacterium sp. IIBBL 290-4 TaxID=2953890 RepID=UPI0020B7AA2D|nr:DNA-binding protein [Chromobacterium sp. IIBBL 290-4]UTH73544.1 DNA-binding protein [Chromobacterium sp. IIBBL 290-4]
MAADIYARIRQAAFELVAEGVWPTVVDVRARLGSGSNTTINNTLKEWRQEFLSRVSVSARRPDWPSGVAEAFEQLWQKACDGAEQQLESLRQEVESERTDLRQQLQDEQASREGREAELQSLRHELELRTARQIELESLLNQERAHGQERLRQCETLQTENERLRDELTAQRKDAEARQAELEEKSLERVQAAQEEASRREALAYERLEGLRVRLYQQVEDERKDMAAQLQKRDADLLQTRQDAAKVENLWRERLLERERENGGLQAKLDMLQQQLSEAKEDSALQKNACEHVRQQLLEKTAEHAGLKAACDNLPEQWLNRAANLMQSREEALSGPAMAAWLQAEMRRNPTAPEDAPQQ